MRVDLRVKHDGEARKAAIGLFELEHGYKSAAIAAFVSPGSREKMAGDISRIRERGPAAHGRKAGQIHIRAEGRRWPPRSTRAPPTAAGTGR